MNSRLPKYWIYQVAGWGLFIIIHLFFAITFDRYNAIFTGRLFIFVGLAMIFSHVMRYTILKSNILTKPLQRQLIGFILITIIFAFGVGFTDTLFTKFLHLSTKQERTTAFYYTLLNNALSSFVYLFMWNCIYFIFHFIEKSRNQQFDTLKLEAVVKELELKNY